MQVNIREEDRGRLGAAIVIATHQLDQHALFTDTAIAALLDRHPREQVFALSMGTDPTKPEENCLAAHQGLSGAAILQAVKAGRLWLNVKGLHQDSQYGELIASLYHSVSEQCAGFHPSAVRGTLLVSSPRALVYYHVDGPPSLLWHVRGKKRVWIYPPLDERLVARELLEDIMAGAAHEYVPYEPSFDSRATVLDLEPGMLVSWPQNASHRITNLDSLNVSISTEHFTPQSRARARVYCANRFLRRTFGLHALSTRERGVGALSKVLLHRLAKLARLERTQMKQHKPTLRVDPQAPLGCVPLDAAVS